jgi:2-octaprenyl-6-methoxyphenol hydroxylase
MKPFDIAILGAGPAGMALAALAVSDNASRRVLLIDNAPLTERARQSRVLALSHGSKQILERAGLWDEQLVRCAIVRVHVSQRGRLGRTEVLAAELGVPALGYTMEYGALVASMAARLPEKVLVMRPANATHAATVIDQGHALQQLRVESAGTQSVQCCRLLVHAEGGLFGQANRPASEHSYDYQQHALVVRVRITGLPADMAWERFTEEGPIALVPLEPEHFSLVWCGSPAAAERRSSAGHQALAAELAQAYGERFSAQAVAVESAAQIYPLGLYWKEEAAAGNSVTIGNAAQTLHPVAGQSLNLALRDCAELLDALRAPSAHWPLQVAAWSDARKTDRRVTRGVTHAMAHYFASRFTPLQHGLGLGLLGLDAAPPLRKWVGRQLMMGTRRVA